MSVTAVEAGTRAPLRILVVDDHEVVHWGFRHMLAGLPWVADCLAATSGAAARSIVAHRRPDVALVDVHVGAESGADISKDLLEACGDLRVLLMSGVGFVPGDAAFACGAAGFVPKAWPATAIARAVRAVGLGLPFPGSTTSAAIPPPRLSAREREVLTYVATGATNQEIAGALGLSPHTVKEHVSRLLRRLGARNRAEAVLRAHRFGLL